MNKKVPRRGGGFVVSGSIVGSAIGDGSVVANSTVNWNSETDAAFLDGLREDIASLRAEIAAAGRGEPADSRIQYELQTIEEELDEDEPDGETVRSRWKQVLKLLEPVQHVASVAQITASILALFGGN
ncbi:MAG: hypothetical protein ACRDSZ_06285 [Pseudonocardiaceae bacterium]